MQRDAQLRLQVVELGHDRVSQLDAVLLQVLEVDVQRSPVVVAHCLALWAGCVGTEGVGAATAAEPCRGIAAGGRRHLLQVVKPRVVVGTRGV
eukprot:scaffold4978_cov117-Isochrysis_galbana.AAC.5